MKIFVGKDGRALPVIKGFRNRVLSFRSSVTPRDGWDAEHYHAAAARKLKRGRRLLYSFADHGYSLQDSKLLDIGCGDGANCLIAAHQPVRKVIGIDLVLPLLAANEKGAQTRRLAYELIQNVREVHARSGAAEHSHLGVETLFAQLPVQFLTMDATQMSFADGEFDLLMSRSAMEHVQPIEKVLSEMVRVVRHGGLIYLGIDPFYWLRGCHKRGVVDMPWAHARLDLDDFSRFVQQHEGEEMAVKRRWRLDTLNRFSVTRWRSLVEGMGCEILEWRERESPLGEEVLKEYTEVLETLLPGISQRDLLCERIEVWLRRP